MNEIVDNIMEKHKDFINSVKKQLKDPDSIVNALNGNGDDLLKITDEEKNEILEGFLLGFWKLFLSAQNLALCGDMSAFCVFVMLFGFAEISNEKTTNKDLMIFANDLLKIYSKGGSDGKGK